MKRLDPTLTEPNPEADRAARCGGKAAFSDSAVAQAVARRRKYKGSKVYRCEHCEKFHIGLPRRKSRR